MRGWMDIRPGAHYSPACMLIRMLTEEPSEDSISEDMVERAKQEI
jgi:hypothetical protein